MPARLPGAPRATDRAVDTLLDGVRLLFLDELHAHDPGDAMLLSRLVRALPARGAVLVATSNYPPQGLLPDPRHHALVLPLIAALQEHCDVFEVAGPVDHLEQGHGGARPGWSSGAWAYPGSAAQRRALGLKVPDVVDRVRLTVGGRPLWALAEDDRCVQFDFAELCGGTTSVGDLLELADRYRTLVLSQVPPLATVTPDARRRFANLVDVLWDRDVRLVVLATGPAAQILDADLTDVERMRSRLLLLQAS
jgi:cell division protein ZapE